MGNSRFPELFKTPLPNSIGSSYDFVLTTLNNATTPPTPLRDICPDLQACSLSEFTPGGVYTTSAADGPVTLSVQNADHTFQLGRQNYTFLFDNDLTLASNVVIQASYAASFVSAGAIHVAGSVGETEWASLAPDLEGLFSADKSFVIEALNPSSQQCDAATGQPKEKKLNIKGSVITDAGGGGGSLVNKRDGCIQDVSCPTVTVSCDSLQLLYAPPPLKPPRTFWQEVNP